MKSIFSSNLKISVKIERSVFNISWIRVGNLYISRETKNNYMKGVNTCTFKATMSSRLHDQTIVVLQTADAEYAVFLRKIHSKIRPINGPGSSIHLPSRSTDSFFINGKLVGKLVQSQDSSQCEIIPSSTQDYELMSAH